MSVEKFNYFQNEILVKFIRKRIIRFLNLYEQIAKR